jgi:hypothetical protein
MGKVQDTIDWFVEVKDKTKDVYGTGVEALKTSGEKAKDMMGIAGPRR